MPFSTDIRLPKSQAAAFPCRCVGCGQAEPRSGVTIWTWDVSWWAFVTCLALFWSKAAKTRAPFCRRCAWSLRLRRLLNVAAFAAAICLAIHLHSRLFVSSPRLLRKLIIGGIAIAALVPVGFWNLLRPAALAITIDGDHLIYEFRDPDYAAEFAALNDARVQP
jgi:hypothetical protein